MKSHVVKACSPLAMALVLAIMVLSSAVGGAMAESEADEAPVAGVRLPSLFSFDLRTSAPRPPISNSPLPSLFSADIPLLAYYYIWFDPESWNRAKTDYPVLGRYSSDDKAVMQQHVRWAKAAGIDGFIVSWKNTEVLNRRLELMMEVANEEHFKLAVIYQGLDVQRNPLPVTRLEQDFDWFIDYYSKDPAFDLFDRPLVIWSGTWNFTRQEIARVTGPRREELRILASERSPGAYLHLADIVDGDAYYWSSVNPDTYPGYPQKLEVMGNAVHENGGIWIAPFAPGFDARLIGGTRVVERKDGETLRIQMRAAIGSSPDALGLISWNEFSENSHVEPSCNYGASALDVIAGMQGGVAPPDPDMCDTAQDLPAAEEDESLNAPVAIVDDTSEGPTDTNSASEDFQASDQSDVDSSSPGPVDVGIHPGIVALIGLSGLVVVSIFVIARRSRREAIAR